MELEKIGSWQTEEVEEAPKLTNLGKWEKRKSELEEIKPKYQKPAVEKYLTETGDLETASRVSQGNIEWVLKVTRGIDPDTSAIVKQIAEKARLPKDTTRRNLSEAKNIGQAREVLNALLEKDKDGNARYPYTINWLSNPDKMAQAKDDVLVLTQLEDTIRRNKQSKEGILKKSYRALSYGLLGHVYPNIARIPAGIYSTFAIPQNFIAKTFDIPTLAVEPPKILLDNVITQYYEKAAEVIKPSELDKDVIPYFKEGDYKGAAENLYYQVLANAPNQLIFVAAYLMGAAPAGLAFAGGTQGVAALKKATEEGKHPFDATVNAYLSGGFEAFFESVGTLSILKSLSATVAKQYGKTTAKQFMKEFGEKVGKGFIVEGQEELTTSFAQDFSDYITGTDNALEGSFGRAINAGLVGALSGGLMTGSGAVIGTFRRSEQITQDINEFEEMENLSKESRLRNRASKEFKDFVDETLSSNESSDKIYVPLKPIMEFYQDDPKKFDETIKELGVENQVEEAATTGKDIEISKAKFLEKFANSDLSNAIKNDIRFDPEGMTKREQEEFRTQTAQILKDMQDEYIELKEETETPKEIGPIREKLMLPKEKGGFGLKAEDADAQISIFLAGAKQLSSKRGETLQQWFTRVNPSLEIGGEDINGVKAFAQDKKRGLVQFTDSKTIIKLFDSANMSTFLHETGHIFANEMKSMIDLGLANEQTTKDFNTLLEFADGKFDRKGNEKIARAFEAYLREGKAPSVKLANAFQKFKAWLSAIYKSLTNLNVSMNDEVRGVFNRVLASEREIQEAERYYKSKKSLADLISTTKEQKNILARKKERARASAFDRQVSQHMKAYLTAIGGKVQIRENARNDVNNLSVYKAMEGAIAMDGLLLEDIERAYGDNVIKELKSKNSKLVTKKGQASLAKLAIDNGFSSEGALLDALIKADRKQEAITKRAVELLTEVETSIREDLTKQEAIPGQEAYHNDAQLEYLIAESEIVRNRLEKAQQLKEKKLEIKILKEVAKEIIDNKKVKEAIIYSRYSKAEEKYARQAEEAAKKDDIVAVHEAHKLQVLNHAMVLVSVEAREEKQKIENRYKAKKIKSKIKNIENDYANIALNLIHFYGLSTSESIKPKTPEAAINIKDLDEVLDSMTPEWIKNKQLPENAKDYKDLSVSQFRELDKTINSIMHYGRDELKSIINEQYQTVVSLVNASLNEMQNLKDKHVYDEFNKTGKVLNTVDGLLSDVLMTEFIFERLDNYKLTKEGKFGPLRELFNGGVKAETNFAKLRQEVLDKASSHWDTLYSAKKRLEKKHKGRSFNIEGVPLTATMHKVGRFEWTGERLISFVLNTGNNGNLSAIQNSYGYNNQQISKIIEQFTEKELNAIQGIWDATDILFPQLNQVHFNIYNRYIDKVEAREQVVKSAEGNVFILKGGYYPLHFDHALSDTVGKYKEEDIMKNTSSAVFRTQKPEDGFVYSRTPSHSLPPDLSVGVWFRHIAETARYISHAEYLRDLNRITKNDSWRNLVKSKAGSHIYSQIRDWIKYQARPERRLNTTLEKVLDKQRKLATVGILGANLTVGLKQRLSMFSAVQEIGWKWMLNGFRDMDMRSSILGLTNNESWKKIEKLSPYMKTRMKHIDRELQDTSKRMDPLVKRFNVAGKEFVWKDVQDFMFEWIQMNDRAAVGVVWRGSYNKFLNDNKTMLEEKRLNEAVKYADAIVRTTQPSTLTVDLNTLQRSEGSLRMFTSFMTWTFKFGNRLITKNKAYRDGAISTKDYARHVLYELFLSPWGAMVIGTLGATGDWPEWYEWALAPTENLISWIPFARDIPGYYKYDKDIGAAPAFQGLNLAVKSGKTTWQWLEDDKEFYRVLWDIGKATEFQFGIPALRTADTIRKSYERLDRKD